MYNIRILKIRSRYRSLVEFESVSVTAMTLFNGLYTRRRKRNLLTTVASMDAKVEQPPQKNRMKKRKNRTSPLPPPSFLSLPDEILLDCFARISRYHYRSFSLVSKSIRSLISSPELYQFRSLMGNTEPCLYLCQRLPPYDRWFFVDQTLITDSCIKDESRLSPIAPSSSAPSKSTTVAVGFEIYQMGGTINDDKRPSSAVHVFDCRTHTWRDAPNMTVARKRANSAFIDGKIYVIGGTEESSWAEVLDLKTQTWKPFSSPCVDAKVQLYRGGLYVNSELKMYEYDSKEEKWKECPKVTLGPRKNRTGNKPWCFIENVKFSVFERNFTWYDSKRGKWFMVEGLEEDLHTKGIILNTRIRLANYGGKLLILWDFLASQENKKIWCTVIRLEKRIGLSGLEICGEIEQSNAVLTVHMSYKFLSCITV